MKTSFTPIPHVAAAFAALCLLALVLASPAAAQVVPGDTFNIAITGANNGNQGAFVVSPLTATFGATQMFAGAAPGNQTVTVSSSQSLNAGFITATIMISVPTNFLPAGSNIGGMPVTQLVMQFGGFNAGMNRLDFQNPLTAATFSGFLTFGANQMFVLNPTTQLSNGNQSLAGFEGVNGNGADLSPLAIRAFSFSARFAAPVATPETGETYLLLGGSVAVLLLLRRRMAAARD